jgi:hypothetical protein
MDKHAQDFSRQIVARLDEIKRLIHDVISFKREERQSGDKHDEQTNNRQAQSSLGTKQPAPHPDPSLGSTKTIAAPKNEWLLRLKEWQPAAEIAGVIVLVIYTSVTIALWYSSREANKIARASLMADQRPWVLTNNAQPEPNTTYDAQGHFVIGQPMFWRVDYSNYGHSPALNMIGVGMVFFGSDAMKMADGFFSRLRRPLSSSGSHIVLPPGGPPQPRALIANGPLVDVGQKFSSPYSAPLTKDGRDFIYTHDFGVVTVGRLEYGSSLGDALYWTDFCYSTFLTGAINICPEHNEAH